MKKIAVILLMLLFVSMSLCATSEKGNIHTSMDENLFVIGFFSNESLYDHVLIRVGSRSHSAVSRPFFILGRESSNDDMKSEKEIYRFEEMFSENDLYLLYCKEESFNKFDEEEIYMAYSSDIFFNSNYSYSERSVIDSIATREFIRGILEANNVLILIQKLDVPTRTFSSVKLIDIPLDKDECAEALKKLEAFERIP